MKDKPTGDKVTRQITITGSKESVDEFQELVAKAARLPRLRVEIAVFDHAKPSVTGVMPYDKVVQGFDGSAASN